MAVLELTGTRQGVCYRFDRTADFVGQGGSGIVFRGTMIDETNGSTRDVAIKEVQSEGTAAMQQIVVDRSRREASIRLNNDNLVEMIDFLEIEDTRLGMRKIRYYVISEFLDGVGLDKVLSGVYTDYLGNEIPYARDLGNRLKSNREETACFIIKNVLSAVTALHDNGYIHRDIDPSNIMVTRDGHLKLIDFGICKKCSNLGADDAGQANGVFVGKVEYAAPELIQGKISQQNLSTDIYSIGVLFYLLLTGRMPFEGNRIKMIQSQLSKKPNFRLIKNRKYRMIVDRAMAKKQSRRYRTSSVMRAALDGGDPLSFWLMTAVFLLVVTAAFVLYDAIKPDPKPDPDPGMELPIRDTVKTEIDVASILAIDDLQSLWGRLSQDSTRPVVLYALSEYYSRNSIDESGKRFWVQELAQNGSLDLYLGSKKECSTYRLQYILACLAWESISPGVKYSDQSFPDTVKQKVIQLSKKADNLILPKTLN